MENFYEKLYGSFLGNEFFREDDPVGEPDSSSDESSDNKKCKDERVESSEEEKEECAHPENESMETHDVAEQPRLPRKEIFQNLTDVLNENSYEELPAQKSNCLQD